MPEEIAGPFPGDGSNGPDALENSGVVRRDITTSFGGADGRATGEPLTLQLRVLDLSGGEVRPMAGAALYAWHCDSRGGYSMYDGWAEKENYLRGVQVADEDGWLEFTTIFPGCYPGRWPHVHFEVYPSLRRARRAEERLRTSQLAFPADVAKAVYATEGYEWSRSSFEAMKMSDDMVFADGVSLQMPTMSGAVGGTLSAALNVPV